MLQKSGVFRGRRGSVLVTAVVFSFVAALIMAGGAVVATQGLQRTDSESVYAGALSIAEAGVNYEMRKISTSQTAADQFDTSTGFGVTYAFGGGSFTVYCTNRDYSTPWTTAGKAYIYSTGTLNGITRSVRVAVKGVSQTQSDYAVFGIQSINILQNQCVFNGDIGTNGWIDCSTVHPTMNGTFRFDGPTSNWRSGNPYGYACTFSTKAVQWPTVNQIANASYPTGGAGINYFATHNDNAALGLGTTLTSSVTLTTGNYYFTSIVLANDTLTFDNRNGPINVWVGPSGGTGTVSILGGSSTVKMSTTPNVHIYVGTNSTVQFGGNSSVDAAVYVYNQDAGGPAYGAYSNNGRCTISGTLLANTVDIKTTMTVNMAPGLVTNVNVDRYTFDNEYLEFNRSI